MEKKKKATKKEISEITNKLKGMKIEPKLSPEEKSWLIMRLAAKEASKYTKWHMGRKGN